MVSVSVPKPPMVVRYRESAIVCSQRAVLAGQISTSRFSAAMAARTAR